MPGEAMTLAWVETTLEQGETMREWVVMMLA
jgi:hypothetical protein